MGKVLVKKSTFSGNERDIVGCGGGFVNAPEGLRKAGDKLRG
jgi:hypothetical protein